ncbi:hypothetical protein AST07_02675 [Staphylococcus saprophyticus]|mgnify:FL=1|jgi:hypothetical protein|uniref:hypothetical protein n=1 Tax=Staphylococcus TaxID=1279 RepID=UPI000645613F|nr:MULTISPECIES: hypothetical protein [Staphylococcus]CRV28173.1 Uncharacterised protein [Streptococcus equi subsp. equi]AMG19247.1 hypothetical protein AL528_03035 [Staphylococcus saprophyticus]AMG32360.1 hypothetical protein AL494_00670 [Staphylococcus saprophyticus]ASE58280.1 hypothetical protein CEQ14_03320 [Staphylococcus saprophyticus]MBC2920217.1 hypothetical protein [Staphylococcus saprophyticus]
MSEKEIENHELEQLNKEIEAELNAYDADKEFQKEKKQFLTLTFICKLIIVLLMLMGLVKLFI